MTFNGPPKNVDIHAEIVPTQEDVAAVFERLIGSRKFTETRNPKYDERGLYSWEVTTPTESGSTEFEYNRAGPYPGGKYLQTAVYATFYDKEGMPTGGSSVAKLISGEWNTELIDLHTWLPKG